MDKLQESLLYSHDQVQELKRLVAKGEGQNLEFKRKASHPEKIVREMIAFANAQGGILLVGISDDKTIPGLKFPDDESYVVNEALKRCRPQLTFTETFISIAEDRTVIQYEIPESVRKPHMLTSSEKIREAFVRVDDKSIKASREVREIVKRARRKKDIRIQYGEYETLLMKYLDENSSITLKKFMELSGLNRFRSSNKLILLVLADILKIHPHEKGDFYSLAFHHK